MTWSVDTIISNDGTIVYHMVRLSTFINRYVVADVSQSIMVYRLDMPINGVACPGSATRAGIIVGIWIAYHNSVVLVYQHIQPLSLVT